MKQNLSYGFTLVELIIVVIIVGILAAIGLTQYNSIVEKSRIAEAKMVIGLMRKFAYEYYQEHGDLTGMTSEDAGIDSPGNCDTQHYFRYYIGGVTATEVRLFANRCTCCSKRPYVEAGKTYNIAYIYRPSTDYGTWHCFWISDYSACYGMPALP